MSKQNILNIITLIFAVLTIIISILGMLNIIKTYISVILLCITLVLYLICKFYEKKNSNIAENEKEFLKKM